MSGNLKQAEEQQMAYARVCGPSRSELRGLLLIDAYDRGTPASLKALIYNRSLTLWNLDVLTSCILFWLLESVHVRTLPLVRALATR